MDVLRGLFDRASASSVVRHFVYALVAAYLIAAVPVISGIANDLVDGQAVSGDDFKSLIVATEFAVGTAFLRVVIPELTAVATDFRNKEEE